MAGALRYFWFLRGHWSEGRGWLEEALAANAGASVRAKALGGLAKLAVEQGDHERAETAAGEALALHRELGDGERVMAVLLNLGYTTTVRGDLERAEALLEEELAMSRESKDPHAASMA